MFEDVKIEVKTRNESISVETGSNRRLRRIERQGIV